MMPEYEVYVNDKPKKIELTRSGEDSYAAKIDGKSRSFSVPKKALAGGKSFNVKLEGNHTKSKLQKPTSPKKSRLQLTKQLPKLRLEFQQEKQRLHRLNRRQL
jgi:hypothetical protein